MAAVAGDYAEFVRAGVLGMNFCLTLVRGLDPDEVIDRLGGSAPVELIGLDDLGYAPEVVGRLPDPDEYNAHLNTGLAFVAAARVGEWTMIVEPNGFLGNSPAVERALSHRGALVSFYVSEHSPPRFGWARGGEVLFAFDPTFPAERWGEEPDLLRGALHELGFDDARENDDLFQERTFALMERLSGVRITPESLARATFRCAAVPDALSWDDTTLDRSRTARFLDEASAALAEYAADPEGSGSWEKARWADYGVTDRQVKATGRHGLALFETDPDLARAVTHASPELQQRLVRWLQDFPHRGSDDVAARAMSRPSGSALAVLICELIPAVADVEAVAPVQIVAAVRQAFPELSQVEIPESPPERAWARRRRELRERVSEKRRHEREVAYWSGRAPDSDRLREVAPWAVGLAGMDRDLVDEIAAAAPDRQRAMAAWAARYACTQAGLMDRDWVVEAVRALERGDPPPPSFADSGSALARLWDVSTEDLTFSTGISVTPFGQERETPRIDPEISAIHAVLTARDPDPLKAALDAMQSTVRLLPDQEAATIRAFRQAFPTG